MKQMGDNIQKIAIKYFIDEIKEGKLIVDGESRIYRQHKNKIKHAEYLNDYGYYRIAKSIGGKQVYVLSHRLLYAYYHGVENLDENKTIHHQDHNKTNNLKDNLQQVTREENSSEGAIHFNATTFSHHVLTKCSIDELIRDKGLKRKFIVAQLGITLQTFSKWTKGKTFPPFDKAYLLSKILECSMDKLYEQTDREENEHDVCISSHISTPSTTI